MVAGWNPLFVLKNQFHILHFPKSTGLFTKPTGRHYTKYRSSPDIAARGVHCDNIRKQRAEKYRVIFIHKSKNLEFS
jgi:hypothetical protein